MHSGPNKVSSTSSTCNWTVSCAKQENCQSISFLSDFFPTRLHCSSQVSFWYTCLVITMHGMPKNMARNKWFIKCINLSIMPRHLKAVWCHLNWLLNWLLRVHADVLYLKLVTQCTYLLWYPYKLASFQDFLRSRFWLLAVCKNRDQNLDGWKAWERGYT